MAPVRLEAHARALAGLEWTAFRAVGRPPDLPRRPAGYVPLAGFRARRGCRRRPDLQARRAWRNLDDTEETDRPMALWLEPLIADAHP